MTASLQGLNPAEPNDVEKYKRAVTCALLLFQMADEADADAEAEANEPAPPREGMN